MSKGFKKVTKSRKGGGKKQKYEMKTVNFAIFVEQRVVLEDEKPKLRVHGDIRKVKNPIDGTNITEVCFEKSKEDDSVVSTVISLKDFPTITSTFTRSRSKETGERMISFVKEDSPFFEVYIARNMLVHCYDPIAGRARMLCKDGLVAEIENVLSSLKNMRYFVMKDISERFTNEFLGLKKSPTSKDDRKAIVINNMIQLANSVVNQNKEEFHVVDEYNVSIKNNEEGERLLNIIVNGAHENEGSNNTSQEWMNYILGLNREFYEDDVKNKIENTKMTFRENTLTEIYSKEQEEIEWQTSGKKIPIGVRKMIIKYIKKVGHPVRNDEIEKAYRRIRKSVIGNHSYIVKKKQQHFVYLHTGKVPKDVPKEDKKKFVEVEKMLDDLMLGRYKEKLERGYTNTLGSCLEFCRNKLKYSQEFCQEYSINQYWKYKVEVVQKLVHYFPGLIHVMIILANRYKFMKDRLKHKKETPDFDQFFPNAFK